MITTISNFSRYPALIRKAHEIKKKNKILNLWGTGKVKREIIMLMILLMRLLYE